MIATAYTYPSCYRDGTGGCYGSMDYAATSTASTCGADCEYCRYNRRCEYSNRNVTVIYYSCEPSKSKEQDDLEVLRQTIHEFFKNLRNQKRMDNDYQKKPVKHLNGLKYNAYAISNQVYKVRSRLPKIRKRYRWSF